MAWSIFSQPDDAAKAWAQQFLAEIGAPTSPGNLQFVYDWERSEGGGGKYNPLNQGPVPGQPQLTSTGQQYGGGAADFVSYQAGLKGASDYLNMPAYSGVLSALKADNPVAARTALWESPWASSHYGYGANWSNAAVPGGKSVLPAGNVATGAGGSGQAELTSFLSSPAGVLTDAGALLHGTAVVLDRVFGLFAPGQGWRITFFAVAGLTGIGAYRAYTSDDGTEGGSKLPLAIALLGVASVALFMAARPWPQTSNGPIKVGAYVVDIIEGQPPPSGPQSFSAGEVHLTEAGLAAILGLWAAGKAGQSLSGIAAGAGAAGGILGKVWGWIRGIGAEAGDAAAAAGEVP